jgi:sulfatase-modifying factor enzyme 1
VHKAGAHLRAQALVPARATQLVDGALRLRRAARPRPSGRARLPVRGRRVRPGWSGKRLPTEAECEKTASWDPTSGERRLFPWGDGPPTPEKANLDQLAPAGAGAYPAEASAYGVLGMIGTPGSGPPATSPPTRASSLSPTRSTPKSSSSPTTQGPARRLPGDSPVGHPHHLPQLGLPDETATVRRVSLCEVGFRSQASGLRPRTSPVTRSLGVPCRGHEAPHPGSRFIPGQIRRLRKAEACNLMPEAS